MGAGHVYISPGMELVHDFLSKFLFLLAFAGPIVNPGDRNLGWAVSVRRVKAPLRTTGNLPGFWINDLYELDMFWLCHKSIAMSVSCDRDLGRRGWCGRWEKSIV